MQTTVRRRLEVSVLFDFSDTPEHNRPIYTEGYGSRAQGRVERFTVTADLMHPTGGELRATGTAWRIKADGTTGKAKMSLTYAGVRHLDPVARDMIADAVRAHVETERRRLGLEG